MVHDEKLIRSSYFSVVHQEWNCLSNFMSIDLIYLRASQTDQGNSFNPRVITHFGVTLKEAFNLFVGTEKSGRF
jgi:hypothetical protein